MFPVPYREPQNSEIIIKTITLNQIDVAITQVHKKIVFSFSRNIFLGETQHYKASINDSEYTLRSGFDELREK
eukprot:1844174-Amphidinium_carterae.1